MSNNGTNVCHDFPEPKVKPKSSNVLFCPDKSPKQKQIQLIGIKKKKTGKYSHLRESEMNSLPID